MILSPSETKEDQRDTAWTSLTVTIHLEATRTKRPGSESRRVLDNRDVDHETNADNPRPNRMGNITSAIPDQHLKLHTDSIDQLMSGRYNDSRNLNVRQKFQHINSLIPLRRRKEDKLIRVPELSVIFLQALV